MAELSRPPLGRSFFRLPRKREVEVVLVETPDGRIVARTPDELELLEKSKEAPIAPSPAEELLG